MRSVLFVLILVVVASPISAVVSFLPATEVELDQFADSLTVQESIKAVRREAGRLEAIIRQAEQIARDDTLRVDVIGQTHLDQGRTLWHSQEVVQSQARVHCLLDSLRCDLICIEGASSDSLSLVDMIVVVYHRVYDQDPTGDALIRLKSVVLAADGGLAYFCDHPEAQFTGAEMYELNVLHGLVFDRMFDVRIVMSKAWFDWMYFGQCLRQMRSEVALAKTIIALHQRHLKHGVIIMGAGHADDFRLQLPRYGVAGTYFPTDAP